jgi:hypothetical protein
MAPANAYYRLEHSYLSRKTSGPTHLRAHANYCANTNKCDRVIAVNLSTNRRDIDNQLAEHDRRITRANGRIAEKIQFCHPVQMSEEHRYQATRRFLWRVTFQGQIKAVAFHHDQDTHNPHVHCIILDVSENGAPVAHFGRSGTYRRQHSPVKGNPTEWFRRMWEEECNGVLEEYGYEQRIDRRTNVERGLQEAQKHRGYNNDNKPAEPIAETPPDAPLSDVEPEIEEPIPDEEETNSEDAYEGEEHMAVPVHKRLQYATREMHELGVLKDRIEGVSRLRADYAYWREEALTARQKAEVAKNAQEDASSRTQTAEQSYKETHFMGFRRGININLGLLHFKTSGIDKAIRAEAELEKSAYAEALRNADFREANDYANRATQKVWELEQKMAGIEQSIKLHERINGHEHVLHEAETAFDRIIEGYLEGISPNDVMDAYDNDQISLEDTKIILNRMGHPELVNWIEAQEEDQGIRH